MKNFGEYCNEQCGECPGNGTCDMYGNCDDQFTNCKNASYTGSNCLELCAVKYPNCNILMLGIIIKKIRI